MSAELIALEPPDPLLHQTLDGRYTLQQRLGQGGMGAVYLAEQRSMERTVVVKVIAPALANDARTAARFLREARLSGRITHARVVSVYDFGKTPEGLLYLVMEHVAGRTLSALVAEGPLPVARALGLARQIGDALQAAHALEIVHRDLKPGNVMVHTLGGEDAVKVLDFGLARSLAGDDETVTRSGTMLGTPSYMPPEVARGLGCDTRGDLYALGTVLYELLAGHPPFSGNPLSVAMHHAYQPLPPLPATVPAVVRQLVEQLMEKAPEDRPASARVVVDRLTAALDLLRSGEVAPVEVPSAEADSPPSSDDLEPLKSRPFGRLLVLAGVLVAAGLAGWWSTSHHPDDTAQLPDLKPQSAPSMAAGSGAPPTALPPTPDAAPPTATRLAAAASEHAEPTDAAPPPPDASPAAPPTRPRVRERTSHLGAPATAAPPTAAPPTAAPDPPPTAAPPTRAPLPGTFIRP